MSQKHQRCTCLAYNSQLTNLELFSGINSKGQLFCCTALTTSGSDEVKRKGCCLAVIDMFDWVEISVFIPMSH